MNVGFLHLGPQEHGLVMFGRHIAEVIRRERGISVMEVSIELGRGFSNNRRQMLRAAAYLSQASVVHCQYNALNFSSVWGRGVYQDYYLFLFMNACSSPLVFTLHDVYDTRSRITNALSPALLALRYVCRKSHEVTVSSDEERKRVESLCKGISPRVIPHYVTETAVVPSKSLARGSLNLTKKYIITLFGFIHERKGHHLAVEAMPYLPEDIQVVFAGTSTLRNRKYLRGLIEKARALGVRDRLRITGYLSKEEMARYLAATDLAICPFVNVAASGSISTLISANCPILASDLPLIEEYNRMVPDSIWTFDPYTPQALAEAIVDRLQHCNPDQQMKVGNLASQLSDSRTMKKFLDIYGRFGSRR